MLAILGIAVIGLGGVSRFFLDAIDRSEAFRLAAVCDRNPARLEPLRDRDGVAAYLDAADLLADPSVDAVVLDTPVPTHVELVRASLEAGRHVCCEKPLALTSADAEALTALARERDAVLFTAFHRRYNRNLPDPATLDRDGLASIEVRYLELIEEHADDLTWYATPASAGGGCVVDNGPNAIDVVRHLVGDVTVESAAVERSPEGVDLRAVVDGRAVEGDVAVRVELDWTHPGECKDLRLRWHDGRTLHADMLAGFAAFKSSLDHEYEGILDDFAGRIPERLADADGPAATAWIEDVAAAADDSG